MVIVGPLATPMFSELDKVYGMMDAGYQVSGNLTTPVGIASLAANLMLYAAVSVSIITLAWSFIQYMTASGNPKSIEQAHHGVLFSIIAFFVAIFAVALKGVLLHALGAGSAVPLSNSI